MHTGSSGLTSFVVQIGGESLPVQGSVESGWRIGSDRMAAGYWYPSFDELVFVLINLSVAAQGTA